MYLQAVAGYEKALGRDHSSTLRIVNNLGDFYRKNCRLINMLELVSQWGSKGVALFGALGRLLLQVSDDKSAQRAFQYQHAYHGGSTVYAWCDECDGGITADCGRTVCRHCADVDLCRACFRQHNAETRTRPSCEGHSFYEVILTGSDGVQDALALKSEVSSWFQDLVIRYPRTDLLDRTRAWDRRVAAA